MEEGGPMVTMENMQVVDGEVKKVKEQLSTCDYDTRTLREGVQQHVIGCIIVGAMHLQYEYVVPLWCFSILRTLQHWDSPLCKVHVRGLSFKDDDKLKRPFTAGMGKFNLPELYKQMQRDMKGNAGKSKKAAKKEAQTAALEKRKE